MLAILDLLTVLKGAYCVLQRGDTCILIHVFPL